MDAVHSGAYRRVLISIAALGLLAALLLLPGRVQAQTAPMVSGDATISIPENTATTHVLATYTATDADSDPLAWTLAGDDMGDFTITVNSDDTGYELKFSAVPDFENPADAFTSPAMKGDNIYNVTVTVTDDESPTMLVGTKDVAVTVTNAEEAGTVTLPDPITGGEAAEATLTDPDGTITGITWQWSSSDMAGGTYSDISGATSNPYTPVAADVGKFLKAKAMYTDILGSGKDATSDASSAVLAGNVNPAFPSSEDGMRSIAENTAAGTNIGARVTATGGDNDTLSYSMDGQDSTTFNIDASTGQLKTKEALDFEAKSSYSVSVHVTDLKDLAGNDDEEIDATIEVTISITDVNEAPTIDSGSNNFTVVENTAITEVIQTYVANDPEDDTLTWSLTGLDMSKFTINVDGEIKFNSSPDYEMPDDGGMMPNRMYDVNVKVSDGTHDATLMVVISVTNVDEPGTVLIDGDLTGGSVLTASVTDPDGEISNLAWQWARGSSTTGTFTDIDMATAAAYTLVAADVGKYLKATARYKDPESNRNKNASAMTGQVGASNSEPEFPSTETGTRTLPENSGAGVNVVGGTITATDDDSGDTLTYSLASGMDSTSFEIDSSTGQIKTKTGGTHNFNFEAAKKVYNVVVQVSDGKDAAGDDEVTATIDDTIAVTINLTNVNEAPVVASGPTSQNAAENQTAVATYGATDVDVPDTQSWSVESADDGGKFNISSAGVLTFKTSPNFEMPTQSGATANVYNVTVKVTDGGGLSATRNVAVTVTDVNETPTLTTEPTTASFDENGTGVVATYVATDPDATTGTMSWDLSGNDAGDFNITSTVNGTAMLAFKSPPDFEMPDDTGTDNVYDVTVRVRDNGSTRLEDTVSVAVTVDDVNETPVITGDDGPDFAEIEFDHDATDDELVVGTYAATDDDNADNAGLQTITWDISGTDAAHFSINTSTGELSFSIEPDFENPTDRANMGEGHDASNNTYEVVVEADDGQGESNSVGTFAVTVNVTPVDETPEVPAGVANESFAEIEYDLPMGDENLDLMTYIPRDEEIDTLTQLSWSLDGTDAADFEITEDANGHGTLSFRARPDFEGPTDREDTAEGHAADDNMYEVIVRISDGPNTRDYPLTVTVTNVNERPEFTDESTGRTISEIEYDSGITVADLSTIPATTANRFYWYAFEVRDEEGQDITWTITGLDAADFNIAEVSGFVMTDEADERAIVRWTIVPDYENPRGSSTDTVEVGQGYVFTVNAFDGTNTSTHNVFILVTDVNEQPELTGTPVASVTLDEHDGTLDATGNETPYVVAAIADYDARDQEGGVTWSLTGADMGDFTIDGDGVVTFNETPNFEDPKDSDVNNVYTFTVVATDVMSGSPRRTVSIDVTVTVVDIEETGSIMVDNLTPAVGDPIEFTLSDPDGDIKLDALINLDWGLQKRMPGGTWQTINSSNPLGLVKTYIVDEDDTGLEIRAVVSYIDRRGSGKMAESEGTAAVTADPIINAPPRFRMGTTQVFPEGEANRVLPERLTASDRDNDTLTFGLGTGSDAALFEINASTGQITAIEALDHETTGLFLLVPITLHDGRDEDGNPDTSVDVTTSMTIRVTDVEEDGVVTLSAEEPEAGTPLAATLADGDGSISGRMWQWARSSNGRTGWTNISGATSSSYTPTATDEDFFLRASVTYTDNRGAGKSAEAITEGPVPSENRRPTFPSTEDGARTVAENTRAGANIGAPVAAVDPENNRLTYSLTGADAAAFDIVVSSGQIRVKDDLDFETKSSYTFTIEVHDGLDGSGATSTTIDDTQSVTITVENVDEPGTVTLTSETATIQARVPVTATLEDDDGATNLTWQWARSRSRTSGWANIAAGTSATFTPEDTDIGGYVRATASYNDGEGQNKTAVEVSPRVGQAPPVNSAPAFPTTEDGRREVAEDARGGASVGDPVAATDFNGDTLTYTLSGTDAALFDIGTNDGQLSVASGATLDFEGKRTLRVTVEVTDGNDSLGDPDNNAIDDRQNVTITLTDVNEAPVISGDATASVAENSSAAVATYRGDDPERDTLTWSASGGDFWISQRGQLYFATPPSFEGREMYTVTVTAEDDGGLSDSFSVTVTVTDVEEEGVVTVTPLRGWDGTQFSASLTDGDNESNESWQWQRSSNRSNWGDIPNATSRTYTANTGDVGQYLRATVTYNDDRGTGKDAEAALTVRIEADVDRPTTNNSPEFADTATERSIGQGTAAGRSIGSPVRATDDDRDDVLAYSLSGPDANKFDVDPASGQLRTKDVLDYDAQGTNTYEVTVEVNDGFGPGYSPSDSRDDFIDVTITVTEVAQRISGGGGGGGGGFGPAPTAPSFVDGFRTTRPLAVDAEVGDAVGDPVAATHPSNDDVTYSLSGANASLFTVDAETGQIRLGQGVSLALGQTYTVNLTATDSTGTGVIIIVDIEVAESAIHAYDLNGNGTFEKDEVIKAVSDYFAGLIEKAEALEVVALYFAE